MKIAHYFSNTVKFFRNFKRKTQNTIKTTNELTHPRFKMTTSDDSKKSSNPLLLLMYSKENETLFI